jgi:hypothetical protein
LVKASGFVSKSLELEVTERLIGVRAAHFYFSLNMRRVVPPPTVAVGSGAPDLDLAARGEVTLIINGVTVCVPGDRGGHMGAAIGVGVALPLGYANLTGALLLATGNGDLRHPRCLFCAPSPDTLFHVELDAGMTKTVVAWELGHTFILTDTGWG